jgi:hypothetical protein
VRVPWGGFGPQRMTQMDLAGTRVQPLDAKFKADSG